MNKFRFTTTVLAIAILTLAFASIAQAQATRTWVSGVGDDVNPCSRTAPCKTFAGAISKTAKDGEINAIDPGGFGAVTITKSITIDGAGTQASILAAGTNGIIINITDPADVRKTVRIRNLSINGAATGVNGIRGLAFSKLYVENCVISGFQSSAASRGITTPLAAAGSQVNVSNTDISNCAAGIEMSTTTGTVLFNLDKVRLEGMTDGLIVGVGANGVFRDSITAHNSGAGVKFTGAASAGFLEHSMVFANGTGVQPIAGCTAGFSNTSVLGNTTAISNTGGTLTGHGNNQFNLNGSQPVLPPSIGQQ